MKFRFLFLFFLLTAAVSFSQSDDNDSDDAWFHNKPIRDIIFTGLKNKTASELDGLMNPYKGKIFDESVFLEIQGKLYALEYFDRIEPSIARSSPVNSEVVLRFAVVERPVIGRIIISGNSGLTRREVNDVISSKVHDIFNQSKVRLDIEAIRNKYIEKGYPNVTVTAVESQSSDTSITLIFNIVESEMMSISTIEFVGNTRFSSKALRKQLSHKQRTLINSGAFQEAKLIEDREAIVKYYHDRGYIDARIIDVTRSLEADEKRTNMTLTFMIEEGAEYRFDGVTFSGNVIFSTEQLEKLITSKEGEIVNMTRLEMDLQRVADLYFENGYIYNVINRTPDKNTQTNTISYSVTIVERSRAYIENLIIIGNNKTKDHVILREIGLEPGDIFSRTKVLDAVRNLYNLQFFSMVMPDTLQGSTENLMDLVFTLEEQPTTDIQFGLTFTGAPDTFPISGLVKWNDRNIGGSGNQLGVEVNSSIIDTSSLSVNYMHRWIFGLPLSLGIDLTVNYQKRDAALDNQPPFFYGDEDRAYPDGYNSWEEYNNSTSSLTKDFLMSYQQVYLSMGLTTGYRWSTVAGLVSLSGGLRFGIVNNIFDEIYRPFDPVLREENKKWSPRTSFWSSIALDQRDIFYDPSNGYYVYERLGVYGLFSEKIEKEHYVRSDTKVQYFVTLFDIPVREKSSFKCVLALNAGISVIFKQAGRGNPDSRIPTLEKSNWLAVDGMFVGRGWSQEYAISKGLVLLDNWIELRFPIIRGILAFDLFFDIVGVETEWGYYLGKNSKGERNFTLENFRFGFGGGLRFTIPQFPLRFSIGKRFKVVDGKVEWQQGNIGANDRDGRGLDLVMSFVVSY